MMDFARSPDHPARLRLAGDGEFAAGISQEVEGKLAQKAEGFRPVVFAVAGAVLVESHIQHPVQAVPDQSTGACGFRDGFGCQPGRGDMEAPGRALADLAAGRDAGDHGQAGQAWPVRAAAARHHMQGRASRRAVERPAQRLATGRQHPRPIGTRIVQKGLKHPPEGLRVQQPDRWLNVSWLGNPFSRRRNSRSRRSRSAANSAKPTQLSAPQTKAASAITAMSRREWRCAFPVPGSGTEPKIISQEPLLTSMR